VSEIPGVVVVGSVNLDTVIRSPRLPAPGETVLISGSEQVVGGKGANQAIASSSLVATNLVAEVGNDNTGQRLISDLTDAGVNVTHLHASSGLSGRAYVLVDAHGENSILVQAGANLQLGVSRVIAALDSLRPRTVLMQCEVAPTVIASVASWCEHNQARLVLNLSPVPADPAALIANSDPLIVNAGEARHLCNAPEATLTELATLIAKQTISAVITDGSNGALVVEGGRVDQIAAIPALVVDTTGAGDVFAGVLTALLSQGASLKDAATAANLEASITVGIPRGSRHNRATELSS
jgi:ribokinase